jgi:hypothetical protein
MQVESINYRSDHTTTVKSIISEPKRWNTLIAEYRSHHTAPGEKYDMLAEEIMYR